MSNKKYSDARIPREVGKGALPDHPAIKSPWEKLMSFHDAYHYVCRHHAVIASNFMEVLRIVIPDYNERVHRVCESEYQNYRQMFDAGKPMHKSHKECNNCIFPFVSGGYIAGVYGDSGDERLMMVGRLNDMGPYRAEKELDTCPWDIMGSEICRTSAHVMTAIGDCYPGPGMEFKFYEGRGFGDLHCRAIGENRDKYPMPSKPHWENCEDIATEELIKFTPREQMQTEPQIFRPETGFKFNNGFNAEYDGAEAYPNAAASTLGTSYVTVLLHRMLDAHEIELDYLTNIIEAVFRGAGKMAFGEFFAKKGLRDWVGVPDGIEDGRVMGAYIEMVLQILLVDYKVLSFGEDGAAYDIDKAKFERREPLYTPAYLAMWYGMCRTLVNAEWFLWRETEGVSDDTLRIKIGRKIDKRCL
jgi:hypothetical protein